MDFHLPQLGEGVYEAELVRWLVTPGDTVRRGQPLMEVMTDKATMEVPSPFAGTITATVPQPAQTLKVGDLVISYEPLDAATPAVVAVLEPAAAPSAPTRGSNGHGATPPASPTTPVPASPSVRHFARKLGIDLTTVTGSGPAGRVLLDDLSAAIDSHKASLAKPTAPLKLEYGTPGTRVKLAGLRRKIAEHLTAAKRTIPHYSYVDECEVTELVKLREQLREPLAEQGVKLTYLAFFVKAAALALKDVPMVNASLDDAAGEIVFHDRSDVGIAVATPAGLVVPVIRQVDRKDLSTLARDIDRLGQDARENRLKLDDLQGGTFTVTSIGGIGGLISTPIVNHPQVGIMGIGKVVKRPVYDATGTLRPADMLYLSFSFDHRVVDGAVGAAFGNAVLRHLAQPARLLLPG